MDQDDDINPFAEQVVDESDNGDLATSQSSLARPESPPAEEPPPLPTKQPVYPEPPNYRLAKQKTEFCCERDRWLHSEDGAEIKIVDAQKTSDGSNSSYITYIIRSDGSETRRRYSEFESLRTGLAKLYPTLIIPPIPSKTSLGDYAVKQSKAKEDVNMIARRKRLLQSFLNRIAQHPILCSDHVFHRFLASEVSWSEVLHSPPLSLIPKNLLRAPAHSPVDQSAPQAYAALPLPSPVNTLRNPDQRFIDSEAFTDKFASHVGGPMEKVTRRTMKRWSELAADKADLGAALNGFSLNEEGPLATAIEKTGQAIDATYLSTTLMLQEVESQFAEPLHEYGQFAQIIRKLLLYRHQKHLQYEMTQAAIETKKAQLAEFERVEAEAARLASALSNGGRERAPTGYNNASSSTANRNDTDRTDADGDERESDVNDSRAGTISSREEGRHSPEPDTTDLPSYNAPIPKRRTPGMGLLNALSYTIHGMMDVDPETARRNNITKTRETIAQLEDGLQLCAQDLKYASIAIQTDLDRFQRQKVADIRDMTIALAMAHRDWCKKNLEAWEEVQKELKEIELHPNDRAAAESNSVSTPIAPSPAPQSQQ